MFVPTDKAFVEGFQCRDRAKDDDNEHFGAGDLEVSRYMHERFRKGPSTLPIHRARTLPLCVISKAVAGIPKCSTWRLTCQVRSHFKAIQCGCFDSRAYTGAANMIS